MSRNIIISLTTYKDRFDFLIPCLSCLLNQTYKVDKIVLTLYVEDYKCLPVDISEFISINNIEIIICDEDLKPHKKYYYVFKKYKDSIIITADDDRKYNKYMVKDLIESYEKYPNCISARNVKELHKGLPYKKQFKYKLKMFNGLNPNNLAIGVGGILYPPSIIKEEWLDINMIKQYINVDDLYLKYIENLHNIIVVYAHSKYMDGIINYNKEKETSLYCNYNKTNNDIIINELNII